MTFTASERKAMLALKGVGPTVIARLEQMGYECVEHLQNAHALDIVSRGAQLTGSSCWKNSPQACAAIQAVLDWANKRS